jgi:hypothetical protein
MVRASRFSVFLFALSTCFFCGGSLAGEPPAADTTSDIARIYEAFLSEWLGGSHSPSNVSKSAELPTSEDVDQYAECAKDNGAKDAHWAKAAPISDLGSVLDKLSYVRLVDPKTWHAQDPGSLIAKGQSVDSAVDAGFASALMTLSAITFNEPHDTAFFTYSFRCGRLCGHGGAVMFKRTSKGWAQSKQSCSSWTS